MDHSAPQNEPIDIEHFTQVELRVGRVLRAEPLPKARKPAYRLWLDFGPLGEKQSSAQLTALYTPEELVGRLVVAVCNFPPRKVAGFRSDVLVLGVDGGAPEAPGVVLLQPERDVAPGTRVY